VFGGPDWYRSQELNQASLAEIYGSSTTSLTGLFSLSTFTMTGFEFTNAADLPLVIDVESSYVWPSIALIAKCPCASVLTQLPSR